MPKDNLLLWGAVAVGAWMLLKPPANQQGPMPAGGAISGGSILGGLFSGLFASSGDEDIGIAPVAGIAAPGPAPGTKIAVQDSNTPVIDQTPTLIPTPTPAPTAEPTVGPSGLTIFQLEGTKSGGFNLTGPTGGLTGSTQIRVLADPSIDAPVFESFATTPDTLALYLAQFNQPAPTVEPEPWMFPINTFAFSDE